MQCVTVSTWQLSATADSIEHYSLYKNYSAEGERLSECKSCLNMSLGELIRVLQTMTYTENGTAGSHLPWDVDNLPVYLILLSQ